MKVVEFIGIPDEGGEDFEVLVNVQHVALVYSREDNKGTTIEFVNDTVVDVYGTVAEVLRRFIHSPSFN